MNDIVLPGSKVLNKDLRRKIVDMVVAGKDGHIPSAYSILDIITLLYRDVLKIDLTSYCKTMS